MKKIKLLISIFLLGWMLINTNCLKAQSGQSCDSAKFFMTGFPGMPVTEQMNDTVEWYKFVATGQLGRFVFVVDTSISTNHITKITVYSGTCGYLALNSSYTNPSYDSVILLNTDTLIISNTYYIKINKGSIYHNLNFKAGLNYKKMSTSTFCDGLPIPECNLITNGGFEDIINCPYNWNPGGGGNDGDVLANACGWCTPTAAGADLFNTCSGSGTAVSVPLNFVGTEYSHSSGNGYAGLYTWYYWIPGIMPDQFGIEQMQVNLNNIPASGETYVYSMYVSLAEGSSVVSGFDLSLTDQTGCAQSSVTNTDPSYYLFANISNPPYSTATWALVDRCFTIPSSGYNYNYLTISGDFNNNSGSTLTTNPNYNSLSCSNPALPPALNYSYYYIDDVSLVKLADAGLDQTVECGNSVILGTCDLGSSAVYSWSPSTGLSWSGNPNPIATPTVTTTYTLTVTYTDTQSNVSTATDEVTVTITPIDAPIITGDISGCLKTSHYNVTNIPVGMGVAISVTNPSINTITTGSGGAFSILWGTGAFSTGEEVITVTFTSDAGCTSTSYFEVFACCESKTGDITNPNLGSSGSTADVYGNTPHLDLATEILNNLKPPSSLPLPSGFAYPSSGFIVIEKQSFSINGDFIVNVNLELKDCDVLLGANANIILRSCTTLKLTGSHLHGCDHLWGEIYVPGSQLSGKAPAKIISDKSMIEDAWSGITSEYGGSYLVTNTLFNRNFKGMKIMHYGGDWNELKCGAGSSKEVVAHSVVGSVFTCRDMTGFAPPPASSINIGTTVYNLIGPTGTLNYYYHSNYPNYSVLYSDDNTTGHFPFYYLKEPITDMRSWNGIEVNNITNDVPLRITDYDKEEKQNTFDYLNYGIQSMVSNLEVYNNIFINIYNCALSQPVDDCSGVWGWCFKDNDYRLYVGDGHTNQPNYFYECYNGIKSDTYNNFDGFNYFENQNTDPAIPHNTGIEIINGDEFVNIIYNNDMKKMKYGIKTENLHGCFTWIENNVIEVDAALNYSSTVMEPFGIGAFSSKYTKDYLNIDFNNVKLFNIQTAPDITPADGIRLMDVAGEPYNVYGNQIYLEDEDCDPVLSSSGIKLQGCDVGHVNCNWIENSYILTTNPGLSNATESYGIFSENSYYQLIYNNTTTLMASGLGVKDNNWANYIFCNSFQYGYDGILFNNAFLPDQIGPVYGTGNEWDGLGTFGGSSSLNKDLDAPPTALPAPFKWYWHTDEPDVEPFNLSSLAMGPLTLLTAPNDECQATPGYLGCDLGQPSGGFAMQGGNDEEKREMMLGKIVRGENNFDTLSAQFNLRDSIFAFSQLSSFDTLMNLNTQDDGLYQNFYSYLLNRPIGKLEMVKRSISDSVPGHIDNAIAINQSISPEGTEEENQKLVNTLYLKKQKYESDSVNGVGAHYVFDSAEVFQLESVAYQKAILGGDAVYLARVLLWIEVRDNSEMQTRSLMTKPKVSPKISNYKLYPNPSDGSMTLEYKIEGSENATLIIYDMTGRLVKQQILNAQNSTTFVDASELNSGVYYYVVKEGNRNVKTAKLVIVK